MKKLIFVLMIFMIVVSCKKNNRSPEGPTDVRIRNLTDQTFNEIIVSTSEYKEDVDTIPSLGNGQTSEYYRFKKAYPNLEISTKINIGGSMITFSTGPVDYTYLQYMGRDRITYEVYIPKMENRKLEIFNRIVEEPLVLK
jgi:hypothetical protein